MESPSIPYRCQRCPYIEPYLLDIQNLESKEITPEVRRKLIVEQGYSPEDVDRTDADNRLDQAESRKALADIAFLTLDCLGTRIINLDPSAQSSESQVIVCQSPHLTELPRE